MKYRNSYKCSQCGCKWSDEWDCMCDDRCPECDTSISPTASEIIGVDVSQVFTCPECGENRLEEVMYDVTVSSVVNEVHECGDAEYSEQTNDGGVVDRFQCINCGWMVPDVKDLGELFRWLNKT